jgi:hypothetical protein
LLQTGTKLVETSIAIEVDFNHGANCSISNFRVVDIG